MNTGTQGRAEYETWRAAVPDRVCNVPAGPWDELSPGIRAGFAAIAATGLRPAPGESTECEACGLHRPPTSAESELAMLRADLASMEAEIGRWPRCRYGCHCRVGTDDADALECGCDGPCTTGWEPEPAPEQAATVLAEVLDFLGDGIPPGDEFALQVAAWRKRGLAS